jgi:G3E family GTPase
VVVTDVLNAPGTIAAHDEAAMQLAAADRIVLSKTDLATPAQTEAVARLVRTLNPTATLEGASEPEASPAPAAPPPAHAPFPAAGGHLAGVGTLSLELDTPLDWQVFGVWLTLLVHAHADRLLRFKASIDSGGPGPVLLDAVQAAVHPPRHLPGWGDAPRRSRLTFITRDLDTTLLEPSLAAFQEAFAQDGGASPASAASPDSPVSRTPASSSSSSSCSPS